MTWRDWTIACMGFSVTLLLVWDVITAFFNDVPNSEDTESGIILGWFTIGIWPIAWAWGMLGAHFVMPGVLLTKVEWWGILILVASALALSWVGLKFGRRVSHERKYVALRGFSLLVLGMAQGWLFFPQ